MAKRILFLDDNPERHKAVRPTLLHDAAYTADGAIAMLRKQRYDIVFLDHDLNGNEGVDSDGPEPTGHTVALWIVASKPQIPLIVVHSMNPVGAERIEGTLKDAGYTVVRASFLGIKNDTDWILNWKPEAKDGV